ncbi:MAG: hypothetical protein AAF824_03105 [Bacteroidota bacterium]
MGLAQLYSPPPENSEDGNLNSTSSQPPHEKARKKLLTQHSKLSVKSLMEISPKEITNLAKLLEKYKNEGKRYNWPRPFQRIVKKALYPLIGPAKWSQDIKNKNKIIPSEYYENIDNALDFLEELDI